MSGANHIGFAGSRSRGPHRQWSRRQSGLLLARGLALLCALTLGVGARFSPAARAAEKFPEYQLKAAFLFNFAKFVTWPDKAFAAPDTPLTIGILGTDPFGSSLRETVAGKTVNGRKIAIKPLSRDDTLSNVHLLFISRSERDRLPAILAALEGQSVLTVSETERFAHIGGMINFFVQAESVRFEFNPPAAERAGLRVSSKLASVAVVVKPDAGK
jgi:hypothetical protein